MDFTLTNEWEDLRAQARTFIDEQVLYLEADRAHYDDHENIALPVLEEKRVAAKAAGWQAVWTPTVTPPEDWLTKLREQVLHCEPAAAPLGLPGVRSAICSALRRTAKGSDGWVPADSNQLWVGDVETAICLASAQSIIQLLSLITMSHHNN